LENFIYIKSARKTVPRFFKMEFNYLKEKKCYMSYLSIFYFKTILEDIVGVFNEERFSLGSVDSIKLGLQLLYSPAEQVHL